MNNKTVRIVESAIRLFSLYGVKRTGMSDIAAEAGISRQTLYGVFSNKAAVLQGTIRLLTDRAIDGIEAELREVSDLSDQLDVILRHIAVEPFELLHASPHAADIVAGVNEASQRELDEAAARNTQIIRRVLQTSKAEIASNGLKVDQLADFIQRTAAAAKYSATSKKHLLSLLAALKVLVLKATQGDSTT